MVVIVIHLARRGRARPRSPRLTVGEDSPLRVGGSNRLRVACGRIRATYPLPIPEIEIEVEIEIGGFVRSSGPLYGGQELTRRFDPDFDFDFDFDRSGIPARAPPKGHIARMRPFATSQQAATSGIDKCARVWKLSPWLSREKRIGMGDGDSRIGG